MTAAPGASAWLAFGDAACRFVFLNWAFHATCLLLAGLGLSRLPRLRPAGKHAVLAAALLLAALAPVLRLLPLPSHPVFDPAARAALELPLRLSAGHLAVPASISRAASRQSLLALAALPLGWALLLVWAAVALVRLSSLGHGAWQVSRWSGRGVPADRDRLYEACGYRLADLRVLESDQVSMPGVVGIWQPCILLPPGLTTTLELPALRHVLLHEEAHARRQDPLVLFAAELLHAVLFWHPLAAATRRLMETAAEEACDAHVLAHGVGGPEYARTLLTVLETARPAGPARRAPTCPFGPARGQLTGRVARILSRGPQGSNVLAAIAGGTLLTVASSSITAQVGRQPLMPRWTRPRLAPATQPDEATSGRTQGASRVERAVARRPAAARFCRAPRLVEGSPRLLQARAGVPQLAGARAHLPRTGRCIVFALDVSTSMQAYLDPARAAILEEVNALGPEDRFDVIAFATEVGQFAETPVAPGEDSRAALRAWLESLATAQGSDLGAALTCAFSMPDVSSVVLISDGQATRGVTQQEQLAALARRENRTGAGVEVRGPAPAAGSAGEAVLKSLTASPREELNSRRDPDANDAP